MLKVYGQYVTQEEFYFLMLEARTEYEEELKHKMWQAENIANQYVCDEMIKNMRRSGRKGRGAWMRRKKV